eukprot:gene5753-7156_t
MDESKTIPLGTRVSVSGKPELGLGYVRYCGMTKFSPGRWVGIELDSPGGKNDGTVLGEKYFECKPLHGLFVKPNMVVIASSTGTGDDVDDSKLMPPPPTPTAQLKTSSGIRPPSSTGIRPPSSLGSNKPRSSLTPSSTSSTSGIKKPTESGLKRPVSSLSSTPPTTPSVPSPPPEPIETSTKTTTTATTTDDDNKPSPPPLTTSQLESEPKPATPTLTKPETPSTSVSKPASKIIRPPSSVGTSKIPKSSTTTTTTTTPPPSTTSTPPLIPTATATSTSSTTVEPKPTPVVTPTPEPPKVQEQIAPPTTTTPQTPTSSDKIETPTSDKKKPKIMDGEDDDEEEEEEINTLLNKSLSTEKDSKVNENVEKMMQAINELNDYKIKSQDQINELLNTNKELQNAKDKLMRDFDKQIQQLEKTIATKEKENENLVKNQHKHDESSEKQLTKIQQEFEKEKENLMEQIGALNDTVELLTMEKEFAEEKLENTENEMNELKEELELVKIKVETLELERQSQERTIDESLPTDIIVLQEQNEKLKETLVKLRDVMVSEKHETQKKLKDLESTTKQNLALTDRVAKLEQELSTKSTQVEELQQALEDAESSEALVTDLSEKNMELGEELSELKITLADLEAFRDLASELEENQAAVERSLRKEINEKEIENLNLNAQLANFQLKLQDADKTIIQFRDLVSRLQHKLEEMRRRDEEQSEQNSSWTAIQQQLLSKNIQLQHQVIRATEMEIDHQLEKSKAKEAELHLKCVMEFLPEQSFQPDNDSIKLLLTLKRIILKSELAQKYLNRTYKVEEIGTSGGAAAEGESLTANQVGHSLQVIHILDHLIISATWLLESLERCSADQWLRSGRSTKDIEYQERVLDNLLNLIKQEQYGSTYSSIELEKINVKLDSILTNIFGAIMDTVEDVDNQQQPSTSSIYKSEWSTLLNYILNIQYNIKQVMLTDINISQQSQSAHLFPQKEMSKVLSVCRKVIKNLSAQPLLRKSTIVRDILKSAESVCNSILQELNSAIPKIKEDPTYIDAIIPVINVKAESLLQLKSDSSSSGVFDESVNEEELSKLSTMERIFTMMHSQLTNVIETILAGDLDLNEQEKTNLNNIQSPWAVRAVALKQSLGEVGNLRDTITSKEQELLENLKTLKAKEAELLEEKRKEESFDKRIKTLQKSETTLTDRLTQVAKELKTKEDTEKSYRQEIIRLRDEVSHLDKDVKLLNHKNHSLEKKLAAAPTNPVNQEHMLFKTEDDISILSLKKSIKYLRTENARLKSMKSTLEMSQLESSFKSIVINHQTVSSAISSSKESSSAKEKSSSEEEKETKKQIKFNEIVECNKLVNSYITEILEVTATPKVLDISPSAKQSSPTPTTSFGLNEIEKQKAYSKQMQKQVESIHSKLSNFIASNQSTNYTDINQVNMVREGVPKRIAKISLPPFNHQPSNPNSLLNDPDIQKSLNQQQQSIQLPTMMLYTNPQSFKELHQIFV